MRMHAILDKALAATAELWPRLVAIFAWIAQAAAILDNPLEQSGAIVRAQYQGLLERLSAHLSTPAGEAIGAWASHFLKITRSYWPGLFHCYDVADLPRTDNDLEHLFGRLRHQERRITGRKVATPALVVRGSVRVLSALLSWLQPPSPAQLGQVDPVAWREERRQLDKLRQARVLQLRFRQHPEPYLAALEERLVKLSLPP
jgi:hypothetical protein